MAIHTCPRPVVTKCAINCSCRNRPEAPKLRRWFENTLGTQVTQPGSPPPEDGSKFEDGNHTVEEKRSQDLLDD